MNLLSHVKHGFPLMGMSLILLALGALGCGSVSPASSGTTTTTTSTTQHILFVGDSFTHGRYLPVRTYNNTPGTGGLRSTAASAQVVDENYNTTVAARMESSAGETGPWGGIPGIFAELASEAKLSYNVHIEAISATSLTANYAAAQSVIAQSMWNAVVLQEASFEPIPGTLTQSNNSNPQRFCNAVQTIEAGVHAAAPSAGVYLYATAAPADYAWVDSTNNTPAAFTASGYLASLNSLTAAYHDAYVSAAAQDGKIAGIAPVGDAWNRAWTEAVANPDPYGGSGSGPFLSFNYQSGSQPSTVNTPTDAGFHHPSIYGAYLSGLVLFQKITGTDARTFGSTEQAASTLDISGTVAVQLQQVAWESVTQQSSQLNNPSVNLCTVTH